MDLSQVTNAIAGHPWWSVGGAFAAGLVAGMCARCCCACRRRCGGRPAAPGAPSPAAQQQGQRQQRPAKPQQPSQQPPMPPLDPGDVELYVGNLSYATDEESLRKEFERFGTVKSARIITTSYNKSKGYGFVIMPDRKEAEAAIAAMNDHELQGRKLRVNEAKNARPQ